jgi:glucose-6-phosphate isomerase
MPLIKLDFANLFSSSQTLDVAESPRDIKAIQQQFQKQLNDSDYAYYSGYKTHILQSAGLHESLQLAKDFRERFETLVILGIGGSALGTRAVFEALKHVIPDSERRELRIIDNLDPIFFARESAGLDWKKTAVAVISKSGGTIETMAQFSWFLRKFQDEKLDYRKHMVAITDPSTGSLRKWVLESGVPALPVPADAGGRYSVFTPVGIFPLAFAGLDGEKFFEGARKFYQGQAGITDEETLKLARRLCDYEDAGLGVHALFLYSTVLRECGAWFVQLWGESLGKIHPLNKNALGTFPVTCVGATDQHSILQLLMEGRLESVVGFVKIKKWAGGSEFRMQELPVAFGNSLAFAQGKSFDEILNGEARATQKALENSHRPVYGIELDNLSEESVGAWMAFTMDLTSAAGAVQGINPYDQPGVEVGKKILKELL